MTETLKAPLAAPLTCPDWCASHRTRDDESISHSRQYPADREGRIVVIMQTDTPANGDGVTWIRGDATITIVSASAPSFDVCGLTPEQAYALAAMLGDSGNEPLAANLLDAAIAVKPGVER